MRYRECGVPWRALRAALALACLAAAVTRIVTPARADGVNRVRIDDPGTVSGVPSPSLTIDDASIAEYSLGARNMVFTVHLSVPAADTVTVHVTTLDSTATVADGDYVAADQMLAFPPGAVAESLTVKVLGDAKVEDNEQFLVLLSEPDGATLARSEAVGTIVNVDLPVLTVADTSVAEGDVGVHPMSFRVRLSPPAILPVSFHYETLDGTATVADLDYQAVAGDTVLAVGQDQVVIQVPIQGDSLLEGNERFTLRVSSVQGANPAQVSATGTILNDERTSFVTLNTGIRNFGPGTLPPAFGDLDGDGRPDLPLYSNTGTSFAEMSGVRSMLGDGNYHGAAWCDYDRDGRMDFVQLPYGGEESGYNYVHLFNNTPTGLQDVAPSLGMNIMGYGETPTWADFNADGWPDLFMPFYTFVSPFQCYFFLNLGNGQFQEYSDSAGVALRGVPAERRAEGVAVADWNGDGALDLYVASHLFLNDGNAHFTDVRAAVGLPIAFDEGAQFVDYDNDGDLDLYLRTSSGPTLFRNDHGTFTNVSASLGLGFVDWGWGDRWVDIDDDGDMDLIYFDSGGFAHLLLNQGDGTFQAVSSLSGLFTSTMLSSLADIDGDGDPDIAVGDYTRQFARNLLDLVPRAHTPYLKVRVVADDGTLTEQGATVRLRSLDDPKHPVQTRILDGGSGYLGQDEYTVTFGGVGSGAYDLEVSFPTKPGIPGVVGPLQNPLLGGIRPGDAGPKLMIVRPNHAVAIQSTGPALSSTTGATAMTAETGIPRIEAALFPASPNPTRGATNLGLSLPAGGAVTLTIHDLSGRKVRTLVAGEGTAGQSKQTWDLRDDAGRNVPVGLYFARLIREGRPCGVQRVVVLR
jgi:hypothetical protein